MVAVRQNLDQFTFDAGTSTVESLTGPRTDGRILILVSCMWGTRQITSITQTGATWVEAANSLNASGTRTQLWYAENISGAAASITVNHSVPTLTTGFFVMEYSGVLAVSPLDRTATAVAASSTAPKIRDPTLTAEGNELWVWGLSANSVGLTTDRPHMAYQNVALQDYGSFSLSVFEMTENIRGEPQGICRSSGASQSHAMVLATFKADTPLSHLAARVQSLEISGGAGAGPFVGNLDKAPTTGNLLVAFVSNYETVSVSGITQTNVSWAQEVEHSAGSGSSGVHNEIWFGTVSPGAGQNISIATDASAQIAIVVVEYTGLVGSPATIDTFDVNDGTSSPMLTGLSAATSGAERLFLAGMGIATVGGQFDHHSPAGSFATVEKAEGGSSGDAHALSVLDRGVGPVGQYSTSMEVVAAGQWATILLSLEAIPAITTPPTVSAESPAPDAVSVLQLTDISFHVGGVDGVTQASIDVDIQIDAAPMTPAVNLGVPALPFDGPSSSVAAQGDGFDVTLDYRGRLPRNSLVTVRINADNSFGTPMNEVLYTFVTDSSLPSGIELLQIAQG